MSYVLTKYYIDPTTSPEALKDIIDGIAEYIATRYTLDGIIKYETD